MSIKDFLFDLKEQSQVYNKLDELVENGFSPDEIIYGFQDGIFSDSQGNKFCIPLDWMLKYPNHINKIYKRLSISDAILLFSKILNEEIDFIDNHKIFRKLIIKYIKIENYLRNSSMTLINSNKLISLDQRKDYIDQILGKKIITLILCDRWSEFTDLTNYLLNKWEWGNELDHFLSVSICGGRLDYIKKLLTLTIDFDENYWSFRNLNYEIVDLLWNTIPDLEKLSKYLIKGMAWQQSRGNKIKMFDFIKILEKILNVIKIDGLDVIIQDAEK